MKTMNFPMLKRWLLAAFISLLAWLPGATWAQVGPTAYFLQPPDSQVVRITSPANHAVFYRPVDIPLFAYVHDPYSLLANFTNVEFYASNAVGVLDLGPGLRLNTLPPAGVAAPNVILSPITRLGSVYCRVWTNAPAGAYALRAVARGLQAGGVSPIVPNLPLVRTSAPVNITILTSLTNPSPAALVSIVATDPVAVAGTNTFWTWYAPTNATPVWTNWPPKTLVPCTNWGPKNAVFTVFRHGNALSNLVVNYAVGGTAVSNVDYVGLPGSVTIPAGAAAALIPVVPLDNHATNDALTVILSLKAATNQPPAYQLGYPTRAEAIIVDYWPRALPWRLADQTFHLSTNGPDGAWFCLQNSSDLLNWTNVATNQVVNGSIDFADPDAPHTAVRFFRTVPQATAPGN